MSVKRVTLEVILENKGNVVILCQSLVDLLSSSGTLSVMHR